MEKVVNGMRTLKQYNRHILEGSPYNQGEAVPLLPPSTLSGLMVLEGKNLKEKESSLVVSKPSLPSL